MASPNYRIECGICLEEYNGTNRRPNVLPCGHNFCGPCLHSFFAKGGNMCSICRKIISTTKVDDVPINTDLEKVIGLLEISLNTSKSNVSDYQEEDFSYGQCSKHKKSWLYFKCRTHDTYVCKECTVIQHAPPKCDLIEIEELVEEVIYNAELNMELFGKGTTSLGKIVNKKKDRINQKKIQIDALLKEIEEESKFCNAAQHFMDENKNLPLKAQECIDRLKNAKTNKKMNDECTQIIDISEKILKEFDGKFFSEVLLKDIRTAAHHISERVHFYAVNGQDKNYGGRICKEYDCLNVYKFEHIVGARKDSTYIPVSTVYAATDLQPIVWMCIQGRWNSLVLLKIRLTCGPKRRDQMLRLFTHQDGPGFSGSWIDVAWDVGQAGEGLECYGYTTNGYPSDRIDSPIVQDLEENECERYVEGAVTGYVDNARFVICTRTQPVKMDNSQFVNHKNKRTRPSWMGPEIGRVVKGLDLLRKGLETYTSHEYGPIYDASDLKIRSIGVEIPFDDRETE